MNQPAVHHTTHPRLAAPVQEHTGTTHKQGQSNKMSTPSASDPRTPDSSSKGKNTGPQVPLKAQPGKQSRDDWAKSIVPFAEQNLVVWAKIRDEQFWPAQVVQLEDALRAEPRFAAAHLLRSKDADTCLIHFGTCYIAFVNAQSSCIPWRAGVRRGLSIARAQPAFFSDTLRQVRVLCESHGAQVPTDWWYKSASVTEVAPPTAQLAFPDYQHAKVYQYARGVRRASALDVDAGCDCGADGSTMVDMLCADESCFNVAAGILCATDCAAGRRCLNQTFERRAGPRITPFATTDGRGWGLRLEEDVVPGTFIVEYVGEIIRHDMLQTRMRAAGLGDHGYYVMDIGGGLFLDAKHVGNLARFINSSCEPNCETQKWTSADTGETHIGVFSTTHIAKGTEITYDYCFHDFNRDDKSHAPSFECLCGAASCRTRKA